MAHAQANLLRRNGLRAVIAALVLILVTGCTAASASTSVAGQQVSCNGGGQAQVPGMDADQTSNAQAIAQVALGLGLGEPGVLVGVTAALTESGMRNLTYGDMTGPGGTMSDSRGMFQMKSAWGSLADRLNPSKAAEIFYTVDNGPGVRGLMHIPGWQQMTVPQAAQAVEGSQYSGGSNYQAQLGMATNVTTAILATCTATGPAAAGAAQVMPCTTDAERTALVAQVLASPNLVLRAGREASQTDDITNGLQCNLVALIAALETLGVPVRLNSLKSDHPVDQGYHPKGMGMDLGYPAGDPIGATVYAYLYRNYLALNVIQIIWAYPPTIAGIDPTKKCIQQDVNGIAATHGVLLDCDTGYPNDISGHTDHIHVAIHL